MNFFEFENKRFKGTWTKETIEELQNTEPNKDSGTPLGEEQAPYYCWRGTRLPQWFE